MLNFGLLGYNSSSKRLFDDVLIAICLSKCYGQKMPEQDIKRLLEFANNCVDKSGVKIRSHFRNLADIESKNDESPVTIADKEAEKILRNAIKEQYPDHGIHGEEYGVENPDAEYKWIIDPIDGTASFMIGRPIFGTLIGLLKNGKPILGVIDQPITGERWVAGEGCGTTFNNSMCKTRNSSLSKAILCTTSPEYLPGEALTKFNQLASKVRYTIYGGDCYNYGLLAAGHVDLVVESGLKQHDFWPLIPIIIEAGGVITDWQGNELTEGSNGDVVAAANGELHKQVLAILNAEG